MEIDQFKNLWKEDQPDQLPEINLESKKLLSTPLQRIRKNMKMEFLSSIFIFPLVVWLLVNYISQPIILFYALMLLGVSLIVIGYYYLKFYKLYRQIDHLDWNTFHNLLRLKYDLMLNVQMYKSYYLTFIPILLCELILVFQNFQYQKLIFNQHPEVLIINFVYWFLMAALSLYFTGKAWLYYFYDKYIIQISEYIDALDLENNTREVTQSFEFGGFTLQFLRRYFKPTTAYLLHLFLWFWISVFVITVPFIIFFM